MNKPKEKRSYPQNLYAAIFGLGRDEQVVIPNDVDETLEYILSTLTAREKDVILLRFKEKMRDVLVGELYGICRQRVHQIENKALRKLRHPVRADRLRLGNQAYEKYREEKNAELEMLRKSEIEGAAQGSGNSIALIELDLSTRPYNCLLRAGIETLRDVCESRPKDYRKVRNFGTKSAQELLQKLNAIGIDYAKLHEGEFDETTEVFFGLKIKEVHNERFQRNPAMQD